MTRRLVSPIPFVALLIALSTVPAAAADPPGGPRLLAKLPGPAGTDVAFSRDGKLILTAGGDEARVWDAETYKPLTDLLKHPQSILLASISSDGKRVLTCAGHEAHLWDAATGGRLLSLKHPLEVRWADVSADGSKVVTGCEDGKARIWDARSGDLRSEFEHKHAVQWLRLVPDGSTLVTLSAATRRDPADEREVPGLAHVWVVAEGEELDKPHWVHAWTWSKTRRRWVMPIDVSPDGRVAATVFTWIAAAWQVDGGGPVLKGVDGRGYPDGPPLWPGWPHAAAFSPDGRRLAFACSNGVGILDVTGVTADDPKEAKGVAVLGEGDVETMAFSPDGRRIILGGSRGGSGVWDVDSQRLLIPSRAHPAGESPAVAFSPDGKRVAAGFTSDGFTGIWEVPDRKQP